MDQPDQKITALYRLLRAHQYLYYIEEPIISDHEFDQLENEYIKLTGRDMPVGSDLVRDYSGYEIRHAQYLKQESRKHGPTGPAADR